MGPADLRRLYPRFDDFVRVMRAADPNGVWQNPYTRRHLLGSEGGGGWSACVQGPQVLI